MGLGTELLLLLLLGFLILGPKQMHALLERVAHIRAEFDKATRTFKSHLTAQSEIPYPTPGTSICLASQRRSTDGIDLSYGARCDTIKVGQTMLQPHCGGMR